MNRSNLQSLRYRAADTVRAFRNKVATGTALVGVALTPGMAFATGTDPAAAITTELSGIKTSVGGILVVLAAVVGLMLLWSYIKRAK